MVDLKFCDLLGTWQHVTLPLGACDADGLRRRPRLRRLVDPRLAGDHRVGHAAHARPSTAILDPATEVPTLSLICEIADPITKEPLRRATRAASRSAPRRTSGAPAIADTAYVGAGVRVLRLRRGAATTSGRTGATTRSTRPRATGTPASRASATRSRRRRATSRRRRTTRCTISAPRMVLTLERLGIPCEFHHHEVASGGPVRDRPSLHTLTTDGRPSMTYKYVVRNVATRDTASRDLHAEADLRRQRLRACTATSRSGRKGRR